MQKYSTHDTIFTIHQRDFFIFIKQSKGAFILNIYSQNIYFFIGFTRDLEDSHGGLDLGTRWNVVGSIGIILGGIKGVSTRSSS